MKTFQNPFEFQRPVYVAGRDVDQFQIDFLKNKHVHK